MDKYLRANLKSFHDELRYVDEVAQIVLKGQLLIEESLTRIIAKFVFHPKLIPPLRLGFVQKMDLARSMSLDESENGMWNMIAAINELRNQLSHSLDTNKRILKVDKLRQLYLELCKGEPQTELVKKGEESQLVSFDIAQCLGFLGSFEAEVDRFKELINEYDKVRNPHRYRKPKGA